MQVLIGLTGKGFMAWDSYLVKVDDVDGRCVAEELTVLWNI